MESVGAVLRRIREQKGLTLEDISRMTKIRSEILRGIEDDDYHQISDGPFLAGFVRSYARSLGEPEEEVERLAASLKLKKNAVPEGQPKEHERQAAWWRYAVGTLVVVAAFVALLVVNRDKPDYTAVAPQPLPPVSGTPLPEKTDPVAEPGPVPLPPSIPPAGEPAASPAPLARTAQVRLEIRVVEDCWIRVAIDDTGSRQELLQSGDRRSWEAQEEIRLTVGNAGGVTLHVNGKEHAGLGAKGQVLRDIVVTAEGVTLPRVEAQ